MLPETDQRVARRRGRAAAHRWSPRSRSSFGDPPVELAVTISIGVAVTEGASETTASLLHRADEALYAAKAAGRNRVISYSAAIRATAGAVA